MNLLRFIRAALLFARHQAWVDAPVWTAEDAAALTAFLDTNTGNKLKASLLNMTMRQQAAALSSTKDLKFEAGFCTGQKATIMAITAMADTKQFTEPGEDDADPTTS